MHINLIDFTQLLLSFKEPTSNIKFSKPSKTENE